MPRGSFLVKPARSVTQLTIQIRKHPKVAQRYTNHFGVPASQFAQYAQAQLGLRRLPRSGRYRVYFVMPDGRIGSTVRRLRKGTLVFLHLRSRQPVLLGECGNPLTAQLPGYIPARVTAAPPRVTQPPVVAPGKPSPLEPPVPTLATQWAEPSPPAELQTVDLSPWYSEPAQTLLAPDLPAAPVTRVSRPHLAPLLLVGLVGLMESAGKPANPPPVIPEPASVASLSVALVLLMVGEKRRRARNRGR